MDVTTSKLIKAAGAAAVIAGSIFIAVQINHPPTGSFDTQTAQWVARSWAKTAMAVLALAGITGMYLRQHRRAGLLGLTGYVVFALGYLGMFGTELIAAAVLPTVADTDPGYANDVIVAATGGTPVGDIGAMQTLLSLTGAGYMLGGLVFGIALFRTGVLARWAAVLLAASTVGTAALAVLPEAFNRPFALPEAIALIALGVSLWRSAKRDDDAAPGSITPSGSIAEAAAR